MRATILLLAVVVALMLTAAASPKDDPPVEETFVTPGHINLVHADTVARKKAERKLAMANRTIRKQRKTIRWQHGLLKRRWRPTVHYALRLASAVSGVSYWQLRTVSWCESRHWPFATNGQYRGLFQEGPMFERHPIGQAGFNVFDPLANALVAATTASREGWRQWACRP